MDTSLIIASSNGGSSWHVQYRGSPDYFNIIKSVYFIDKNTGWATSCTGKILKTTNGGEPIGIKKVGKDIPVSFSLSQNYPNPFNPSTKIKFSIPLSRGMSEGEFTTPGRGGVLTKLIIFDLLGCEVATLVNEKLQPGEYEVEWPATSGDASNYASGIYFYKLVAGDFSDTRKMVLIK
jgi:hypothetical protein